MWFNCNYQEELGTKWGGSGGDEKGEGAGGKGCIKQLKLVISRMKWCNDFSCNCHSYHGWLQTAEEIRAYGNSMLLWQFFTHNHSQLNKYYWCVNIHKYCLYIHTSLNAALWQDHFMCPLVINYNKIHQNQISFHEANTKNASAFEMYLHVFTICAHMLK